MPPEPENPPAEDADVIAGLQALREEYAQNAVGYTWSVRSAGYTSDVGVTLMSEMSKAEYDLLVARYQVPVVKGRNLKGKLDHPNLLDQADQQG